MATPSAPIRFTPLDSDLLSACAEIAATAPDPWSYASLEKAKDDLNRWSFVAHAGDAVAGFACFMVVAESADLEQLVISPAFRRRGIARLLLHHSIAELSLHGAQRLLLEVRCSNTPAIQLYKSLGFKTLARRPGMYQNPKEDGFLMALGLAPGG